ncbi:MAG: DNA gyrase inhibitor YacG [Gammaproteobacteria bacterium]|nr:DNA gyrase inhibitor YacG [Gammaproteobacteria bacterium]MBU1732606.1 DNA gyrase inhibitor YacG [Gammaproteobacteria bacterium]MBU1893469.1 DNA gyrase inhibitor YacG [Gammaproteobacteria bacterium]
MPSTLAKHPTVLCPVCGKDSPFTPKNPFRPFCSQRCKLIDLGQWANEEYRVPDSGTRLTEEPED